MPEIAPESEGTEVDLDSIDFENFGAEADAQPADSQPVDSQPVEDSGGDEKPGIWDPIFSKIPQEFHEAITPELRKWEQNANQRFQQIHDEYSAYKPFRDQQISPQDIQEALGVYQNIGNDPLAFFENYKQALLQNGMLEEAQEVQDAIDEHEDETTNPVLSELRELKQRQAQWEQQIQQQYQSEQQAKIAQQADHDIAQEFADLEAKHGAFSPSYRQALAEKAWAMQQQSGQVVPLEAAHNALVAFMGQARKASPAARAPKIGSAGGGMPGPGKPDLSTEAGREAAAFAVMQRMQG